MDRDCKLFELVEKRRLEEILHGFTEITGVSSFIVSPNGRPISEEFNWSRLCSDYCRSTEAGKRLCYQSDHYGAEMSARFKKRVCYTCLNAGLVDCTSPIIVGNYHIASFMCGQVLHHPIDETTANDHAAKIGIKDTDGYLRALERVPIISHERLDAIVDFMGVVTKTISELAWNKYLSSKQSRRHMMRIVNRVSDGIISIDKQGRISMVNNAFARTMGTRKDQIIGQYFSTYLPNDASLEAFRNVLLQVENEGHGRASISLTGVDDREIQAHISFDKDRQERSNSAYVAVLRDMSEEKKLETLKEELIGMMTHDLQNPIVSIQKAMQLLGSGELGPLGAAQEKLIKLSEKTTRQLSSMVMDYMDIYRHENGKLRLRKELLDIRDIVRESVKQMELIAGEKEIVIHYDPPPEELTVMGDRLRLLRICLNLLGNATNFSPEGGTITITTRSVAGGDVPWHEVFQGSAGNRRHLPDGGQSYMLAEITDQGPGIEKGFERAIFDKFVTGKGPGASHRRGVGLGLAFCKLAIEAHHGFIGVKSHVADNGASNGSGSSFYFALPADVKVIFDSMGMVF